MQLLITGLIIFFVTHIYTAFRSREPGRDIKVKLGSGLYMGLYSLAALGGLALIIYGFGAARPAATLYTPPSWGAHANIGLMLVAMIVLVSTYLPVGYIKKTLKHPMLVAVKLWASGHLLANGDMASVLLFGSFLAYAVLSRIAAKKRGDNGPPANVKASIFSDIGAVLIGAGLWAVILIWLHPILFGVAVMV